MFGWLKRWRRKKTARLYDLHGSVWVIVFRDGKCYKTRNLFDRKQEWREIDPPPELVEALKLATPVNGVHRKLALWGFDDGQR